MKKATESMFSNWQAGGFLNGGDSTIMKTAGIT